MANLKEGRNFILELETLHTANRKTSQLSVKFLISLAQAFNNVNDREKALVLYQQALAIKQSVSDEMDVIYSIIFSSLGYFLSFNLNKFNESIAFTQKALKVKQDLEGEDHINVATE